MRHTHTKAGVGQSILNSILLTLLIAILGLAAIELFGSKAQHDRAKDLLSIFVGLFTPLLTAAVTLYFAKRP